MTHSTDPIPEWLDDWGGLHTLDDGHDGSYDHEALAGRGDGTVTLTCQCGAWSGSAPAEGDDEPEALFGGWKVHVYEATGRLTAELERLLGEHQALKGRYDRNVRSLVEQFDQAVDESARLSDVVDDAVVANAELAADNERLQHRNEDLKAGLLAAEADAHRLRESLSGEQFILWGELALHEAKAQARLGRRLKGAMHDDPAVAEAWVVFRDALDAAIRADIASDAREAQ